MDIKLDSDTADRITRSTLLEHIALVKQQISELTNIPDLTSCQQEDLGYDVALLASLERVVRYFGA